MNGPCNYESPVPGNSWEQKEKKAAEELQKTLEEIKKLEATVFAASSNLQLSEGLVEWVKTLEDLEDAGRSIDVRNILDTAFGKNDNQDESRGIQPNNDPKLS